MPNSSCWILDMQSAPFVTNMHFITMWWLYDAVAILRLDSTFKHYQKSVMWFACFVITNFVFKFDIQKSRYMRMRILCLLSYNYFQLRRGVCQLFCKHQYNSQICQEKRIYPYLIIVIFFTLTQFLENKIYTEIYTVNCQFTQ